MPTLAEIREKYPDYSDLSDQQLADSLYRKHYSDMPRDQFNAKIGFTPPPEPSGFADFFRSIPRGVVSGLSGAASAGGQAEALSMSQPELAEEIPDPAETTELIEQHLTGQLHKPETTAGQFGASVGEALGSPASYVGPGGLPAKLGYAALGGAGAEAGGQLTDDSVMGRIAGGVAATAAPRGLTRLVSPSTIPAGRQADAAALRARGIEPSAGDVTGSRRIRHMEEMGDLPGGGESFSRNQEASARQYTRALNKHMGVDDDLATPETFQRVEKDLEQKFEAASSGININQDRRLGDGLTKIMQDAMAEGLPREVIDRINAQVQNINNGFITRARGPAQMPGENYHAATREGTPLARAMNDRDPNVAYYTSRIRSELDDALERTARRWGDTRKQSLADLLEARQQFYTMQVLRKSVADSEQAGIEGLISPQKLRRNLTTAADAKTVHAVSKLREAGADDLFELSRSGNAIMSPVRGPRTDRGYTLLGLGSGLGGRAVNAGPVQSWLQNQVAVPVREFMPPPGWTAFRVGTGAESLDEHRPLPEGWTAEQVR